MSEFKNLPFQPTEDQWGGLGRQLIMWMRMSNRHSAKSLHKHYTRCIGSTLPDWLLGEIGDIESDNVLPKGTCAAIIYKAMWIDFNG